MVILDTNIIIDHLRRSLPPTILSGLPTLYPDQTFAVSTISVQELFTGKSTSRDEEKRALLIVLESLEIFPYTYEIARVAGEIQRELPRTIGFADAAIAATAIVNGALLATLNTRDFADIPGLELMTLSTSLSGSLGG